MAISHAAAAPEEIPRSKRGRGPAGRRSMVSRRMSAVTVSMSSGCSMPAPPAWSNQASSSGHCTTRTKKRYFSAWSGSSSMRSIHFSCADVVVAALALAVEPYQQREPLARLRPARHEEAIFECPASNRPSEQRCCRSSKRWANWANSTGWREPRRRLPPRSVWRAHGRDRLARMVKKVGTALRPNNESDQTKAPSSSSGW